EVEQLPTLIPDYIVINIPGMDFPVLACSDACGKSAMISMASYSICPDYAVRSESIKTSTSNLPTPTFHTSHLSVQSINSTGNNDNTNCDYEKNYVMQDWISNSLINSDDKTLFGRRLSIDTPCQFRDHVPDEKINTSTSNCLLDATTSTLEIKSKEKSTTACLLNDNMQEISFDDNGSIKLPPHGSYHVNKFNNNS
ncbi:598_t:CDS:1, partial [Scutellospora calospora]